MKLQLLQVENPIRPIWGPAVALTSLLHEAYTRRGQRPGQPIEGAATAGVSIWRGGRILTSRATGCSIAILDATSGAEGLTAPGSRPHSTSLALPISQGVSRQRKSQRQKAPLRRPRTSQLLGGISNVAIIDHAFLDNKKSDKVCLKTQLMVKPCSLS